MGNKAQHGHDHVAASVQRIQVLSLKEYADRGIELAEHEDGVQGIQHISGKAADLLCDNQVDLACLAQLDHGEELLTVLHRGPRNAFIGKNTRKLPRVVFLDHLCVVLDLQLIAAGLIILLGADPAVSTNTQFLLRCSFLGLLGGRNDLNRFGGAMRIYLCNAVLGLLPFLRIPATGPKWFFRCDLHIVHLLPQPELQAMPTAAWSRHEEDYTRKAHTMSESILSNECIKAKK